MVSISPLSLMKAPVQAVSVGMMRLTSALCRSTGVGVGVSAGVAVGAAVGVDASRVGAGVDGGVAVGVGVGVGVEVGTTAGTGVGVAWAQAAKASSARKRRTVTFKELPLSRELRECSTGGGCYTGPVTRRILMTLALLALTVAVSAGLLHAQGSDEDEHPPYRLYLLPGWNVVSLPYHPSNADLDGLFGPDSWADIVLSHRAGDWFTAVRSPEGEWRGPMSTMPVGRLFLVHTPTAEAFEVELQVTWTDFVSSVLAGGHPSILGGQELPSGRLEADDAFNAHDCGRPFRGAYGFDEATNQWELVRGGVGATVEIGAGYWVWLGVSGALCP